uniref:Protein MMS22-like N-terminal domain-containing protein n=1 Tax=Sinocyclocheilus anshuiensis TaxID=1608454 RepID=A0A671K5J4_9TELE
MEGEFSQSLTPPVSPSALDHYGESAPSRPPCFTCAYEPGREETGRLLSNGYISRGALKRLLLKLDPAPADFEGDTVDIFDFPWVTETALVESTKLLFGLFRQKVLKLETLVQSSSHDFALSSILAIIASAPGHPLVCSGDPAPVGAKDDGYVAIAVSRWHVWS